ncbi:MAG: E3 ubiquitin-protein ligase pellino family protein [Blastocatellia bacterium]|nr:E3 ubiquitin-protein ligase pellino family protein [Blastocatellia bacterium]
MKQKSLRQSQRLAIILRLFQKGLMPEGSADTLDRATDEEPDFTRIRCPLCRWQPNESSRWFCLDCGHPEYFFNGCGATWNTFTTRGLCPGCGHQWQWTVCLSCGGWSLHEDWYEKEID